MSGHKAVWLGLGLLLAPTVAWAGDVVAGSGPANITLSMTLDDSISLTIRDRGANDAGTITAAGANGTVNFGTVTVDAAAQTFPTGDLHKYWHATDGTATFHAQLEAFIVFSGALSVTLKIQEGTPAPTENTTARYVCNDAAAPWSGPNSPAHPVVTTTATDCGSPVTTTGAAGNIIPIDLGVTLTPAARLTPNATYLFTTVASL